MASLFIFAGCADSKNSSSAEESSKEVVKEEKKVVQKDLPKQIAGESVDDYFSNHCSGCHGNYGERSALSTSKIIAELSEDDINFALKGFKDGTYGGKLAATMKGNIKNLNYEELEALARYIANDL